ncbi:MAG TPA: cytochrome c oxidase subunit II [Tepidisphaeraceae bacterium]|nr:cytochrome c oxidase subunit II [Tepidisphaeraceae bacterium]
MLTTILAQQLYLPPKASTVAPDVDALFNWILGITIFFCLLIFIGIVVFGIKYRHRRGHEGGNSPGHSTALELTWTIIPTIIVLIIFYYGFRGFLDQTVVPPNAYEIQVDSYMWGWGFIYPNGHVNPELHIPKNRPIRLVLTSRDVIHSLYIPAFRVQKMTVPGRYNRFWVEATQTGEFPILCAQYCGTSHSEMLTKAVVHEQADFAAWLEKASDLSKQPEFEKQGPAWAGAQIVKARGCLQCHSLDGSAGQGPTLKDLFGKQEVLNDGTVTVDENYISESILDPAKRVVKGFQPIMPSFRGSLKPQEIDWINWYLKSISANYKGGSPPMGAPAGGAPAGAGGGQQGTTQPILPSSPAPVQGSGTPMSNRPATPAPGGSATPATQPPGVPR